MPGFGPFGNRYLLPDGDSIFGGNLWNYWESTIYVNLDSGYGCVLGSFYFGASTWQQFMYVSVTLTPYATNSCTAVC
ncbi:MAG: hypothetical protein J5I98_12040 [Phaeodactylibacter sp.]|nr:hypothetical protein [Phaeodactylibacter sp.]